MRFTLYIMITFKQENKCFYQELKSPEKLQQIEEFITITPSHNWVEQVLPGEFSRQLLGNITGSSNG